MGLGVGERWKASVPLMRSMRLSVGFEVDFEVLVELVWMVL